MLGKSFTEFRRRGRLIFPAIVKSKIPGKGVLKNKNGFGSGGNGGFGSFRKSIKDAVPSTTTFDSTAVSFDSTIMTWDMA